MGKFAKFLEALKAAEAMVEMATAVVQMLERFIPGPGKGTIKREMGTDIMKRMEDQEEVDPRGLAIDLAVGKLNATGWDK